MFCVWFVAIVRFRNVYYPCLSPIRKLKDGVVYDRIVYECDGHVVGTCIAFTAFNSLLCVVLTVCLCGVSMKF